jgi:hypothetical protein
MTTNGILHELSEKWLPLPVERFFTMQRAPDGMWFGDELPPTLQDEMASPLATQSKMMLRYQILQQLAMGERRRYAQAEATRRKHAVARVGKRVKTSRN